MKKVNIEKLKYRLTSNKRIDSHVYVDGIGRIYNKQYIEVTELIYPTDKEIIYKLSQQLTKG